MNLKWIKATLPSLACDAYDGFFSRRGVDRTTGVGYDLYDGNNHIVRVRQYGDRFFMRLWSEVSSCDDYEEMQGVTTIEETLAYVATLRRMQ